MLEKNSKPMFFTLLIPFSFIILVCFIGMSMGSIEWRYALTYALYIIIGAWGLSRYDSLIINVIGLASFAFLGSSSIYSVLKKTMRTGPWKLSVYFGAALILMGLIAFIYDIVKLKIMNKSQNALKKVRL